MSAPTCPTLSAHVALGRLQLELDWLEANTEAIAGERAAARESWANVRLELARIGAALRVAAAHADAPGPGGDR